jgi:lipopolysaccharide export system permease protein
MAWSPMAGIWLGVMVLTPLGFFLTYQASNDSSLFNKNAWVNIFKKLIPKKTNN